MSLVAMVEIIKAARDRKQELIRPSPDLDEKEMPISVKDIAGLLRMDSATLSPMLKGCRPEA